MMDDLVAAVDLGGTRFRVALIDAAGTMHRRGGGNTPVKGGPAAVLATLDAALQVLVQDIGWSAVTALSLAVPGPVDPWTGIVRQAPNLPGWVNVDIRSYFTQRLRVAVLVGNDANLAALGELRYGAGRGKRHLIYLTVSTGVGGGVIIANRLLLGARGLAGELGHITVDPHGPRCTCGNVGCLEQLSSGTAIANRAAALLRSGVAPQRLLQIGGDPDAVRTEDLAVWASEGERFALDVLTDAATWLGIGVASFIHIFNPEIVVIGGGVSRIGDLLFAPLNATVAEQTMPAFREGLLIVPASLGDDVGLYGATAWALDAADR